MIALAILAIGLLVIGAALPIGVRYTRDSVNIATGQAAAEHALDVIEQNVCLPRTILAPSPPHPLIREPGLFVPRQSDPPDPNYPQSAGELIPDYEPVIKVRPLFTRFVNATPGSSYFGEEDDLSAGILVEEYIRTWLSGAGDTHERDDVPPWMRWALPSVATVYPPITPSGGPVNLPNVTQYTPDVFLPTAGGNPYARWAVGAETRKVLDSLISWTAFYRRVSYDDPNTPTIDEGDPTLYEFIAVAVRRPSAKHRFPVQDGASLPSDPVYSGVDAAAPVPWLLTFTVLPGPPGGAGFEATTGFPLPLGTPAPATLTFYCTSGAGGTTGLFPVGSIFIPARNDVAPALVTDPDQLVGFGPPAPTTLPIYEVVQRPNDTTVVVRYNGYYPMLGTPGVSVLDTPVPEQWPVWVIPPAFEELSGGDPVFPDRSPILAVARRYVRLRELP